MEPCPTPWKIAYSIPYTNTPIENLNRKSLTLGKKGNGLVKHHIIVGIRFWNNVVVLYKTVRVRTTLYLCFTNRNFNDYPILMLAD